MKCQIRVINPVTNESTVQPQVFESLVAAARAAGPQAKSLKNRFAVRVEPYRPRPVISMHGGAHEV